MKPTKPTHFSRRKFIGASAIIATGMAACKTPMVSAPTIIASQSKPNSMINGVQIGVITYSFRSMADQSAEATLQYVLDTGINAIELMGGPAESFAGAPARPSNFRKIFGLRRRKKDGSLSPEEETVLSNLEEESKEYSEEIAAWRSSVSMNKFIEFRNMYNDAGVQIYGFKPRAFSTKNTIGEIEYGFKAAKILGASHITLEHPSDDAHTLKLGQLAKKHQIYVGYHGHEQQTPTFWDTALAQSKYNALNIDIGHYVAAGNTDPLGILRAKHDRIMSMHVKDRQTPKNNRGNLAFGNGDTPIVDVLRLMRDQKYKFPATIELEYKIPEGSDAVKEVTKCVEYCRRALES